MRSALKFLISIFCLICVSLVSGCSSDSDDDTDDNSDPVDFGQFSGNCSLRVTNGSQCSVAGGPVALLVITDGAGVPLEICSGAVLTPNRILTAAHCFDISTTGFVRVGDESTAISGVHIPAEYDRSIPISAFDVAVIDLATPLQNSAALPLFVSESVSEGDTVNIAGFGVNENGDSVADGLAYQNSLRKGVMTIADVDGEEGVFFADFDSTHQSVCSGDSGGPVIDVNRDSIPGIVGVNQAVSDPNNAGDPRCLDGSIAVFTDIQFGPVLDFILRFAPASGSI